jgi:hypothetical protein
MDFVLQCASTRHPSRPQITASYNTERPVFVRDDDAIGMTLDGASGRADQENDLIGPGPTYLGVKLGRFGPSVT